MKKSDDCPPKTVTSKLDNLGCRREKAASSCAQDEVDQDTSYKDSQLLGEQGKKEWYEAKGQSQKETDRKHRVRFESKVFCLLCCQVGFLFFLILLQGFGSKIGFNLHDALFSIFVGGNMLYAYGIVRRIASDLFKGKEPRV